MRLVGTRDDAPPHAVPVFDQWQATTGAGEEDSHSPDAAGRNFLYTIEGIVRRTWGVGAGDDAPPCPIPMLDQGLLREGTTAGRERVSDGPDVARRDCGNCVEKTSGRPCRVRARNKSPVSPIPVLSQCLSTATALVRGSHGPNIPGGDLGDSIQKTASTPCRIGTRNNTPLLPIPLLNQFAGASGRASHGPDIVGRDFSYPVEDSVVSRCWVRTGNDAPCSAIPVLNERLFNGIAQVKGGSDGPDVTSRDFHHCVQGFEWGCPRIYALGAISLHRCSHCYSSF